MKRWLIPKMFLGIVLILLFVVALKIIVVSKDFSLDYCSYRQVLDNQINFNENETYYATFNTGELKQIFVLEKVGRGFTRKNNKSVVLDKYDVTVFLIADELDEIPDNISYKIQSADNVSSMSIKANLSIMKITTKGNKIEIIPVSKSINKDVYALYVPGVGYVVEVREGGVMSGILGVKGILTNDTNAIVVNGNTLELRKGIPDEIRTMREKAKSYIDSEEARGKVRELEEYTFLFFVLAIVILSMTFWKLCGVPAKPILVFTSSVAFIITFLNVCIDPVAIMSFVVVVSGLYLLMFGRHHR